MMVSRHASTLVQSERTGAVLMLNQIDNKVGNIRHMLLRDIQLSLEQCGAGHILMELFQLF